MEGLARTRPAGPPGRLGNRAHPGSRMFAKDPPSGRRTVDKYDRICLMSVRRGDGRGVIAGCALIQMSEQYDACRR